MNKVILTGHSKGLGKALAHRFLNQGYEVLGISRSRTDDKPGLRQIKLDLSDGAALLKWLGGGTLETFVDGASQAILINNSGIVSPVNPLGKQANVEIVRSVDLNVTAPLLLSNVFVEHTANCPDRRILHISSGAARVGYSSWSVYCATKAALDHHARAVFEDAIANLRISSMAPGIIDTGMQAEIRACSTEAFPQLEEFKSFKLQGSLATPADTATKICSLLLSEHFGHDLITDIRD